MKYILLYRLPNISDGGIIQPWTLIHPPFDTLEGVNTFIESQRKHTVPSIVGNTLLPYGYFNDNQLTEYKVIKGVFLKEEIITEEVSKVVTKVETISKGFKE